MKLEVLEKECFYHIYNRGINGCLIFENDENKKFFLKQFSKYLFGKISIFAFCLMDNHFHLLVQIRSEKEIMQVLKNVPIDEQSIFQKNILEQINKHEIRNDISLRYVISNFKTIVVITI